MENLHTNYGKKKPWGLRPLIWIHYIRSNYTDLPSCFTLKTYSLVLITWSMFAM